MLLFYIRHGDPIYDPDSLTPLGQRQAEAVAKRLAMYGIDRIFASSSTRAQLTSRPTCELLKKEATILDWCHENYAWRDFTFIDETGRQVWGFQYDKVRPIYCSEEMVRLGDAWYDHPIFAGTRFKEGELRIKRETYAWLAELGYAYDEEKRMYRAVRPNEERIALFAHQGFGLSFLSRVLNIPHPIFCTRFDMGHTGMTVLEFDTNQEYVIPRVLTLANDSHLYKDGLPTRYQNRVYF